MKILFKILTIFPLKIGFYLIECLLFVVPINFLQLLPPFQVTIKNLAVAFPALSTSEILQLSKRSFIETIKSFYETLYCWSRSSEKIIAQTKKINNRFLFSQSQNSTGLIIFAIHNRSIDFLLRWMSTQRHHTSLYKTIKSKKVNNFVKRLREEGGNKMVPTGIGGVKSIITALKNNQMTCMASDQVPANGLGKYSKFFGHECFSFSLAPSLAQKTNLINLVRGKGLLNAIVINDSPESSTAWNLCVQLAENGLLAKPTHGNIIRFAPPLVMTETQLDSCCAIIEKTFLEFKK